MVFSFLPSTPEEGPSHGQVMEDWIGQIQYAEELGFDSVWLSEHCFSRSGVSPGGYGMPSPAVQAAYAAARTTRIRIGISVVVLPWHNPVHVAEDFAIQSFSLLPLFLSSPLSRIGHFPEPMQYPPPCS